MIFARFIGPAGKDEALTKGRVYIAKPEVDEPGTVGFDYIEVTADDGGKIREDPDKERFEYLEEVYTVVAKAFDEFDVGEVVVIDGAPDLEYLHVRGLGNRRVSDLIILDRTNLYPGVIVMDGSTGRWVKVSKVDECMWVTVDSSTLMRSPCEFRFAVSDGDIVEPLVKCVTDDGEPLLTEGHLYRLIRSEEGFVVVQDDSGKEGRFLVSRFSKDF